MVLDIYILDLHIEVPGHETLGESAIRSLMASENFNILAHSEQEKLFDKVMSASDCLASEVKGCAVVITYDWATSIRGETLEHCVLAMIELINSINRELRSIPIEVKELTWEINDPDKKSGGVRRLLFIRCIRDFFIKYVFQLSLVILGAVIGVGLTMLLGV